VAIDLDGPTSPVDEAVVGRIAILLGGPSYRYAEVLKRLVRNIVASVADQWISHTHARIERMYPTSNRYRVGTRSNSTIRRYNSGPDHHLNPAESSRHQADDLWHGERKVRRVEIIQ